MDSPEGRRQWADRTGEYSPAYYAGFGADGWSEAVRDRLDRHLGTDASVLELGCSSGRHLAHLHEHGYENLTGIDVNGTAFDVMAESYPDLAATGTFHADTIEAVLPGLPTNRFDAVFSVETLQHIPPESAWVFEDIARVTGDLVVTVENEGEDADAAVVERRVDVSTGSSGRAGTAASQNGVPLYHRDWGDVFTGVGLDQVHQCADGRDTVRAFRTPR